MKKLIITLALALSASIVVQAQAVYSNTVGMIKVTIEAGDIAFICNPFVPGDNDEFIAEDVFDDLASNSELYVWNSDTQSYDIITKHPALGWIPADYKIKRGTGFFLVPAGSEAVDVVLSGEAPDEVNHPTTKITLKPGLNALGFPYPVATTVEDSGIAEKMEPMDEVYIWDQATQNYSIVTKHPALGMLPANTTIPAGASVFVVSGILEDTDVTTVIPYSLNP